MPSIGEMAPPSTWYLPRNSRVRSIAATSLGSSTTQITASSRRGSLQIRHRTSPATLPQTSQNRTSSLTRCSAACSLRQVGRVGRQQMKGDALRGLRADAGQPAEFVDEVLNRAFVHGGSDPAGRCRVRRNSAAPAHARPRAVLARRSPRSMASASTMPILVVLVVLVVIVVVVVEIVVELVKSGRHRTRESRARPAGPSRTGRAPPATEPIALLATSSAARRASCTAATTRSSSVSMSAGSTTDGSILIRSRSPPPLTTAVTSPLPAEPVTSASASEAWARSISACICWA